MFVNTNKIFVVVVLALLELSVAQMPGYGPCPTHIKTTQNFEVQSYTGRWYEYSRYPLIFEINGKCAYAEYEKLPNNKILVFNYNLNKLTDKSSTINGTASVMGPGKLLLKLDNMPDFLGGANYWILDTDYRQYATVYSCFDLKIIHTTAIWILTRARIPSRTDVKKAKQAILRNNLSLIPLMTTDQTHCK